MANTKTTDQFIVDAYCKHGDKYNYKLVDYKNARTKVKIICKKHGIFTQKPYHHLQKCGCKKCITETIHNKQRKTTEQFIIDAYCKHQDKYNYKLVDYKNNHTKVKIICPIHGVFEQKPINHLKKCGCPICRYIKSSNKRRKSTEQFIIDAYCKHQDKYNYKLVDYKNAHTKIKIICPIHGIFEQRPLNHVRRINSRGCPKCAGKNENKYELYANKLLGVECRRNRDDKNILEVKCMYCGRWYIPSIKSVINKISSINGYHEGESNLYCGDECKKACPTFNQKLYPKGYKTNTSREVQPALRKLVLKRDNYTCQKCNATNKELHCHHYEGIEVNPIESADIDQCITLCIDCHHQVHTKDKCGMKDYKRKGC